MSMPEDYREDVYLAESYHGDTLRGDRSGHLDSHREAMGHEAAGREPLGREQIDLDTFREMAYREQQIREAQHRDAVAREQLNREQIAREQIAREQMSREPVSRELGREAMSREGFSREPLNREHAGRVTGSPLPGTPLPTGSGSASHAAHESHMHRTAPPGRALSTTPPPQAEDSAMQRAMGLLKQAAPFVARLLPLLDGNLATTLGGLFAQRPHAPAAPVDLTPVHNQLAEIQMQHNDLRTQVQEQTTGLKRVEDQLEMVREATDRNTLEQQELIEDLKAVGHKVSLIAVGLSLLLVISLGINLALYLYIKKLLP